MTWNRKIKAFQGGAECWNLGMWSPQVGNAKKMTGGNEREKNLTRIPGGAEGN